MDKIYIIEYKETVSNGIDNPTVSSGVFNYCYKTIDEAKKVLNDIAQKKVDELDDEVLPEIEIADTWTKDRNLVNISTGNDTYIYNVKEVIVTDGDFD